MSTATVMYLGIAFDVEYDYTPPDDSTDAAEEIELLEVYLDGDEDNDLAEVLSDCTIEALEDEISQHESEKRSIEGDL